MKHKKIEAILDKKVSDVAKPSEKMGQRFDADVVHDFRVAVKSLRALMRMFSYRTDFKFKLPKEFRRLYDIAGEIREGQLELDKIKETGLHMPDYKKHLLAEVSRAQRDWKDRDTEKGLARLKSRVSDHIPENVTSFAVIDFINSRLLAIHALCLSPVGTDEMVHNMRKLIKDILYVLKAITKEAPHLLTGVVHVPEERLDYFSNILGDYNDARIMLDNMLRYSSGCPGAAERQTIEQLHSENAPKLQNERAWIVSELLNFTGKFAIAEARTGNGPRR